MTDSTAASLAGSVYAEIKNDLFEFRLAPGERFSENELAAQLGVSRTPVREALYRLQNEGYIRVASKSGWTVRPFEFETFEHLYDLRAVLELAAVRRLCELDPMPALDGLKQAWLVTPGERLADGRAVGALDEQFHLTMVAAAGNPKVARVHRDVTERIRIVRRLEFALPERIRQTYVEHGQILRAILRRRTDTATLLLRTHIDLARAEVRKITLHKFVLARRAALPARRAVS